MDRSALLIDAGYLLLGAGGTVLGATHRDDVNCDYPALHEALTEHIERHSGLPHLRTYWYDGAPGPHGEPTSDHRRIAALPRLKLRLGRIIQGQQKGVDTLITLDLLTLARERAIATAYLLTGDEDLREAVLAAQSLGIQVVLIGAPPIDGSRQSRALIDECDEHIVLDTDFWDPFFDESQHMPRPQLAPSDDDADPNATEDDRAYQFGMRYCDGWLNEAYPDQVDHVLNRLPSLPVEVDAPLLRAAEAKFGSLRDREMLRRLVRQGFTAQFSANVPEEAQ